MRTRRLQLIQGHNAVSVGIELFEVLFGVHWRQWRWRGAFAVCLLKMLRHFLVKRRLERPELVQGQRPIAIGVRLIESSGSLPLHLFRAGQPLSEQRPGQNKQATDK